MLISELFDAICWEISVESGSTDFQLVDDITDEWIIFCVFEHRFSMLDGLFIHCPWTIATGSFKDAHFATFPPAPANAACARNAARHGFDIQNRRRQLAGYHPANALEARQTYSCDSA